MYELQLFNKGASRPAITETAGRSEEVFARIPMLLEDNPESERVEVHSSGQRLFSVDCDGKRTPG